MNYNAPLKLKCRINGYPKPEVIWINTNTGSTIRGNVSNHFQCDRYNTH